MPNDEQSTDPHASGRLLLAGAPLETASAAVIALHGRGATAEDIAALARDVTPPDVAIVAPEATGNTWYPHRFLEPFERNEPWLSSALHRVATIIGQLSQHGIPPERVALLGFSQGACLALEAAARNARRYAALIGLSGGLIGPPGTRFDFDGSLAGTPVFLGCSNVDAHIPVERVEQTAEELEQLGASVEVRIYPGMGHTVNRDELEAARALLATVFSTGQAQG